MKKILFSIATIAIIGLTSCSKQVEVSSPYHVGEYLNGGLVAYNDPTGQHGLLSSGVDLASYAPFSVSKLNVQTSTMYGTGADNTLAILNQSRFDGDFYAAYWTTLYISGTNEWYLPSKDELNIIYLNKSKLNWHQNKWTSIYQSSSVDENGNVWVQDFNTGKQFTQGQLDSAAVRAVKQF